MKKFKLLKKIVFSRQVPALLIFGSFVLFIATGTGCSNENESSVVAAAAPPPAADSFLDILYITNFPDSPQLSNLIRKPPYQKIVFTFSYVEGKLTLTGWPSVRKNQGKGNKFDLADTETLHILRASATKLEKDSSYYLGDQELNDTPQHSWSHLDTLINKPSSKYILFYPRVESKHIIYDIKKVSSLQDRVDLKAQQKIVTTNPSPPYSAY